MRKVPRKCPSWACEAALQVGMARLGHQRRQATRGGDQIRLAPSLEQKHPAVSMSESLPCAKVS